ncbi:hypothetical protein BDD12DRAFT_304130 [Trichophaea hybrida]|nr:hypothetical protein BDD12DRAFT_304130 [Trichophaea hybrida]
MLAYNLATQPLKNESMGDYISTDVEYRFHFGTLQYFLSTEKQKGLLPSLMTEPRTQFGWAHPRIQRFEEAATTSQIDTTIPTHTINTTATATATTIPPSHSAPGWSIGQIAGVIVGTIIGTAIVVGGVVILFMRLRRSGQILASTEPSEGSPDGRPELRTELPTQPPIIGSPVSAQHQTPEPETPQDPPPPQAFGISSAPINDRGPPPPIPPNRPNSTINT